MAIAQLGAAAFSRFSCNTVYIVGARVVSRGVLQDQVMMMVRSENLVLRDSS
jgi:hypothetical protein